MPKPNISSKAKSIYSQAGASTIGSYSPASDSPNSLDMPPDETYDMCKELCNEVSESVLCCINECFDAFEAKVQLLAASQAELQARMASQELATGDLDVRITVLETKYTD